MVRLAKLKARSLLDLEVCNNGLLYNHNDTV